MLSILSGWRKSSQTCRPLPEQLLAPQSSLLILARRVTGQAQSSWDLKYVEGVLSPQLHGGGEAEAESGLENLSSLGFEGLHLLPDGGNSLSYSPPHSKIDTHPPTPQTLCTSHFVFPKVVVGGRGIRSSGPCWVGS